MSRGRRAYLPPHDHTRPEYLSANGLVVSHYNDKGLAKHFDFGELPVAAPMQRSLAALFAARCAPARWGAHSTSTAVWFSVAGFAKFIADQKKPPRDLDGLTAQLVKRWREQTFKTSPYRHVRVMTDLLRDEPRLRTGPVADELARHLKVPTSGTQSYSEDEFRQITRAAKEMFRSALRRIEHNAEHLTRWRAGEFKEGTYDWQFGEGLDCAEGTGVLPESYKSALQAQTLQDKKYLVLFPSRMEITALGVLLMAEFGWNLTVINTLRVPLASPDPGPNPTYRIQLHKSRRGAGNYHETRNVTDDGPRSPGRLITKALHVTRFARTVVETEAPGTDRLLVWRTSAPRRSRQDHDRHPLVGFFDFGIDAAAALEWGQAIGLSGSPFRRGRRTVVALKRREPTQHTQNTHDRNYILIDKRVQTDVVDVIAAGAEDAADHARKAVLHAELRATPHEADVPTATADCAGFESSPYPTADGGCGASFLMCLGCTNAHIHPGHHPRLAHLHRALSNLRSVVSPELWATDWGDAHARLEDLKDRIGELVWTDALSRISADDRDLVDHLLNGNLDA